MEGCELNMLVLSAALCHCVGTLPFHSVSVPAHMLWCMCVCACVCPHLGCPISVWGLLPRFTALIFNPSSPHLLSLAGDTLLCHSLPGLPRFHRIFLPTLSLLLALHSLCLWLHLHGHPFLSFSFFSIFPLSSSLSCAWLFFLSGGIKPRLLWKASGISFRPWKHVM